MIQPYLKQHNIVDRLLDFCKTPLNNEVTIFALNLLIKFMDYDAQEDKSKANSSQQTFKEVSYQ